ncbi:hypothetical protein J1N35_041451 [Gossypium stocksii]|uniref:Uncharacterized protein n=1 Tax=Gossypium stocksii TaxID=47602 RepID=A0A9D3UG07_9ROSI|nr:hypothetical protein J1N35_041451 [Gossypium stocksii]
MRRENFTIANKMQTHGERLVNITIVEKILWSMLSKFNFVICFIKELKYLNTLSLDELQYFLMVHEQKIIQQDVEEQALQVVTIVKGFKHAKNRWKGRSLSRGEMGNQKRDGQNGCDQEHLYNRRPKSVDKSHIECFRCQKDRIIVLNVIQI